MIKKNKALSAGASASICPSELRLDLISKDWVVIATGRARRPETFKKEGAGRSQAPKKSCPFCNLRDEIPISVFSRGKRINLEGGEKMPPNWTTISLPNKYPAVCPNLRLEKKVEGGLYQTFSAVGFHEVVVTRDHKRQLAQFKIEEIKEVFDVYQERHLKLMKEKYVAYVSIFHNHGAEAGASISHPHSQIITTPLIDADLRKALSNSKRYLKKYGECIYCKMNEWEKKSEKRIIFENKNFLVVCPFASKAAFEVIISPKRHLSYFETITDDEKWDLAEAFGMALRKLYKGLGDPAYNFYLHTTPADGDDYNFYHWHWTILPKTATWAGFEIGTRMEISTIEPERAAEYLRKQK